MLGRHVTSAMKTDFTTGVLDIAPPRDDEVTHHQVDVLDFDAVNRNMKGYDAVVHLAGIDAAIDAPEAAFFTVNTQGTWNVLQAAENNAVSKVVLCSSVAAVGLSPDQPPLYLPVDANHPCRPVSAYGLSKQLMEVTGCPLNMYKKWNAHKPVTYPTPMTPLPSNVELVSITQTSTGGVSVLPY